MSLPPFTARGDLPAGIHRATLAEVLERFGSGSSQRMLVGLRLERVYNVAWAPAIWLAVWSSGRL